MDKKTKEKVSTEIVLKAVMAKAKPIQKKLKALAIKDQDSIKVVGEQLKLLKAIDQEGKRQMDELINPLDDLKAKIKGLFQPFFSANKELTEAKKQELQEYMEEQKRIASKVQNDFASGKIKKVETLAAKLEDTAVVLNGRTGLGTRNMRVVEIVDVDKIPREYMMPDMAKIKEAMKEGNVPGCKWGTKTSITV